MLRDGAAAYTPGISERRGSVSTFHHGLKNADSQSSTAQAVTATRVYDAFGNLSASTGTWSGPFGYAGGFGYQEDPTGLRLLGHRYCEPSTGRFLTRDPIKDGRSWYAYGGGYGSPTTGVDPDGLFLRQLLKRLFKGGKPETGTKPGTRPGNKVVPRPAPRSWDEFLNDTDWIRGRRPDDPELKPLLDSLKREGWVEGTLTQGSKKGQGFKIMRPKGNDYLRWHPGGGHHGPRPYWKYQRHLGHKIERGYIFV